MVGVVLSCPALPGVWVDGGHVPGMSVEILDAPSVQEAPIVRLVVRRGARREGRVDRICQNAEYTLLILYGSFQARGQNPLDLDGHAALLAASILLCGSVFGVLTGPRPHQASYQARKNSTSTGASASVLTSCLCPSNIRSCACGMAALNARAVSCMKG